MKSLDSKKNILLRIQFSSFQKKNYRYHGHYHSQYTDGLTGPLVIYDPEDPVRYGYDAEIIVILGDWYHRNWQENENSYLTTGVPPFPDTPLLNGMGLYPCISIFNLTLITPNCNTNQQFRSVYFVQPNKVYRLRVINMSAMSAFTFSVDGHMLLPIEVDGVSLDKSKSSFVDYAMIVTAQRYSFLLTTDKPVKRYV